MLAARQRLIVALDVPTAAAAMKIVAAVGNSVATYKVGLELHTAVGPQMVRDILQAGHQVFLDLKYHDIPHTVSAAIRAAAALEVSMLTVHASGGDKMIRAAVEAAQLNPDLKVLAVTVLTSMNQLDLNHTGVAANLSDQVLRLADTALKAGCHGIVASAHEASELRQKFGKDFLIVTPGVRPSGADHQDQARVVTPAGAIQAGASYIVVGRPIASAPDPASAAKSILEELIASAP